ncbi:MAG: NUDIX hydrolase [Clostridiales bacterium]|nr:NUDIX hydrolase [Clostridiales bacterium]
MERWKTERSEALLDTPWVKVRRDAVRLSNGAKIDDFYAITIRDAAAIVALDGEGCLILKREYRYCQDRELLEIPAGAFNDGETDPLAVAQRELLEETGYVSDCWEYLGQTVESSAKMTNKMHLFLARNCRKVAEQKLDETEELTVERVPLSKAVDMVMTNEICCNSSAHGILRTAWMMETRRFAETNEKCCKIDSDLL